jgi:hypothetical protein
MNTIIRRDGKLQIIATVKETVIMLSKQPGRYTIADIQKAINDQLTEEHMSYIIVKRALATILEQQSRLVRK